MWVLYCVVDQMCRNEVAIERAQALEKQHVIKASAYKVDGELLCVCGHVEDGTVLNLIV